MPSAKGLPKKMQKKPMFTMVLSDSLFSFKHSETRPKFRMHDVQVKGRQLRSCLCVANWASFLMPREGRRVAHTAIGLAVKALSGGEPEARRQLRADPVVRVVVVPAERSIATCRKGERFPRIVQDRLQSQLVQDSQVPWTILDLEDHIMQRQGRRKFKELEDCRLRDPNGIYDPKDQMHFRRDVAYAAGDELLSAIQRTALARYGRARLAPGRGMVLVLAAGWNTEKTSFSQLDSNGEAWRKADLVALAELCALNGQRLSVFFQKMQELLQRGKADHSWFVKQQIQDIGSLPAQRLHGDRQARALKRRRLGEERLKRRARSLKAGRPGQARGLKRKL